MKSSSGYEIYHNTLSSVLDEIERYVHSKGYEVGDYFPEINHVSYGTTYRTQLEMLKDGRIANTLAIQIYRLDNGKYELNCYPVRKFSTGGKFAIGGKITFKKNTNNPNFITINIEYEIIKGSSMALGKQTMSGQMSQLSAKEAYKKGLEIVKKLELKYNIEDIEVTDLENGIVQVFAVSNDFVNLPINELQKFKDGGSIIDRTMHEFKRGQLHSSSGDVVRNPKQAIAIGLSKERRGKFSTGGVPKPKASDYPEDIQNEYKKMLDYWGVDMANAYLERQETPTAFKNERELLIAKIYHHLRLAHSKTTSEMKGKGSEQYPPILFKNLKIELNKVGKITDTQIRHLFDDKIKTIWNEQDYLVKHFTKNKKFATGGGIDYRGEHKAPSREDEDAPLHKLELIYPEDIYSSNAARYYGANGGDAMDRESISIMQSARNKPNKPIKIYRAVPDINFDVSKQLKELNSILNYNDKWNFFPSNNQLIYSLQDKYSIDNYSYDKQKELILEDIKNQINSLESKLQKKIEINNNDWVTINRAYAIEHGESNLNNQYKILSKTVKASELFTDGNSIHEFGYSAQNPKMAKGGGIKSIKIGDKFHYKFDGKYYKVLEIEDSKIVLSQIPIGSYWNNKEISFSLMNKWIIEKTMRKI